MDQCIQIEIDHATSFRENVWSFPYFLILDFSTLPRDGGLNCLCCQTRADLNRKLFISKHSWAEQPAAPPSATCSQTKVAIPRAAARQATESGVSSPAYYVVVPQTAGAKALLQWSWVSSFIAFKLFSPLPPPSLAMESYYCLIHLNPKAKFSALGTLLPREFFIKTGHSNSTSIPFLQAVFMNTYSSWNWYAKKSLKLLSFPDLMSQLHEQTKGRRMLGKA